jgi:MFS family permease
MVLMVALARNREWVVGLFETALGLGFATGPLLGGLLGEVSWRLPFFARGVSFPVDDLEPSGPHGRAHARAGVGRGLLSLARQPGDHG